jgi:hypothetical protein
MARKIDQNFANLYIKRNGNIVMIGTHPEHSIMAVKITEDETLVVRGDNEFDWNDASVMYEEEAIFQMITHFFPQKPK